MGQSAWRLYRIVDRCGCIDVQQVVHRLGVQRGQVLRLVRRLEACGLIRRDGEELRRGSAAPEQVAVSLGVAGAGLVQRAAHELERAEYRDRRRACARARGELLERARRLGWPSLAVAGLGATILGSEPSWRSVVATAGYEKLTTIGAALSEARQQSRAVLAPTASPASRASGTAS